MHWRIRPPTEGTSPPKEGAGRQWNTICDPLERRKLCVRRADEDAPGAAAIHMLWTVPCQRAMLLDFLNEYRCAEAFAAEHIGQRIDIRGREHMKGGLRTIHQRETFHAKRLSFQKPMN